MQQLKTMKQQTVVSSSFESIQYAMFRTLQRLRLWAFGLSMKHNNQWEFMTNNIVEPDQ